MANQYTEKEKLVKEMIAHIYFAGKDTNPKHFYHYTNAETLPHIFRKDGIYLRFSRFDRLNDMSEGEEITALFNTAITELKKEKKDDTAFPAFVSIIENCKPLKESQFYAKDNEGFIDIDSELKPYNQYVCCFSENPDSVDLWRSYSKDSNGCGCAVEFRDKIIDTNNTIISTDPCIIKRLSFARILYDDTEKVEALKENIKWYYDNKNAIDTENLIEPCVYVNSMLFATRLAFKHNCFKSEEEIRAVFIYPKYTETEIQSMGPADKEIQAPEILCRIKNGITIPYFDYNMTPVKENIPVESIKLSPLYPLTEAEGVQNIKDLLSVQGYEKNRIKISKSKLPLRYY